MVAFSSGIFGSGLTIFSSLCIACLGCSRCFACLGCMGCDGCIGCFGCVGLKGERWKVGVRKGPGA